MRLIQKRHRDERGAIAVMMAICTTLLCVIVAMVLDFGIIRVDRQQARAAGDEAAMAGVNGLITDASSGKIHPFAGACSALSFLKVSHPDLSALSGTWTTGAGSAAPDGCSTGQKAKVCIADNPSTWAAFDGAANGLQVSIRAGYKVNTGDFAEDSMPSLASDTGVAAFGGCDQVAVILTKTREPGLGSLATDSDLVTSVRSVGRITVLPPTAPIALLILERSACKAIGLTSGGSEARIEVQGYGPYPGIIHVDSSGSGCGSSDWIIDGKNPAGGVIAHESADGSIPGLITSSSSTTRVSEGPPYVYAGPAPGTPPTYRTLVTRSIVDDVFLERVRTAMADGNAVFSSFSTPPAGWTSVPCHTGGTITGTKLHFDCGNYNKDAVLPNATDVYFAGRVTSGNLVMPKATRVYITGEPGTGLSTNDFEMNNLTPGTGCAATTTGLRGRLYIRDGPWNAGPGTVRICNTTVLPMSGRSDGCLPSATPYIATYTNAPCSGPTHAGYSLIGASGSVTLDWTAPNKVAGSATSADLDDLEDLAVWDETYGSFGIGGSGSGRMAGLFMLPNADPLRVNGNAGWNVRDSQFIVRRLESTGSGAFTMQPQPSLPIRFPSLTYELVR